jgi:hypothetical protein
MGRFGVFNLGMYPRLRLSLFCGEALTVDTVREWALAAPNSLIENIYGPTELTKAFASGRREQSFFPTDPTLFVSLVSFCS